MESYALKFDATTGKRNLPASGNLFVYESASVAANAETRIRVKPDNGGVIVLKPGQWFRNPDDVQTWALESYSGTDVIDAVFVIGFGEFGDANTLNKFTLDASLANNVTVTNTVASRVPVTLDPSQLVKLDPTTIINTTANTMAYTASYASSVTSAAGTAIPMLSAAANLNGAVLNKFETVMGSASGGVFAIVAKATAPASVSDGDVLFSGMIPTATARTAMDISKDGQPRIAAGKGIWFISSNPDNNSLRDALFTVL